MEGPFLTHLQLLLRQTSEILLRSLAILGDFEVPPVQITLGHQKVALG